MYNPLKHTYAKVALIITGSVFAAGMGYSQLPQRKQLTYQDAFTSIQLQADSETPSVAINSGDFDQDGDLDFIVATTYWQSGKARANLFYFENDGQGHFKTNKEKLIQE